MWMKRTPGDCKGTSSSRERAHAPPSLDIASSRLTGGRAAAASLRNAPAADASDGPLVFAWYPFTWSKYAALKFGWLVARLVSRFAVLEAAKIQIRSPPERKKERKAEKRDSLGNPADWTRL